MENPITNPLLPITIETERLKFRLLNLNDGPDWTLFINDDSVKRFLKIDPTDPKAAEKWILNQHRRYKNNLGGLMAIISKELNEFIGQAGLLIQNINGENKIEVGYHLMPKHRKKGYATEAALGLIKHAFSNNLSNELISLIHIDNFASQKVATNNGLIKTVQINYHNFPVYIYHILNNQYQNSVNGN